METGTVAKHSSVEAKIGSVTFTLSWDGDIMVALSGGEQDRARKLVNGFKLLGSENGAPKERKKRTLKDRTERLPADASGLAASLGSTSLSLKRTE